MGASSSALAAGALCSDYQNVGTPANPRYVVDGFAPGVYAQVAANSTFGVDADCTIKNFPAPNGFPIGLVNFNFPKHSNYIIVFDNVYYTGGMSCQDPTFSDFWMWWVNGSFNSISANCQAMMLPVDGIQKLSPATTAAIGVPFDYKLTFPMMMKLSSTGYVYDNPILDSTPLTDVHIYDDLTTTGANVTYLSNKTYLRTYDPATGALLSRTQIASLTNLGDAKHLHFYIANLPGYTQLEIELKVVLDGTNTVGTIFTNTATWTFDKTINGIAKQDIPGQNGISAPMEIVGPNLVVDKSSTVTNLNVNGVAPIKVDVWNAGTSDAWNAKIQDVLPSGMCATSPLSSLTAQILAADGVTLVKGLASGTDYTTAYSGCTLGLTLADTVKIGAGEHLIVRYDTRFDPSTTPNGLFTNVAGATDWYSDASTNALRKHYGPYTLTLPPDPNAGTPSVADFQDAYTINAAVVGYYLLKSVENRTTGATPSANTVINAYPGDRLRYTLQIQNFTLPAFYDLSIRDDLPALIVPGSLALVSSNLPAGAVLTVTPTGGANGTGFITITNVDLQSDVGGTGVVYEIQFDVIAATPASTPALLSNQARLLDGWDAVGGTTKRWTGLSDDPFIGGPARLGDSTATFNPTNANINKPGPLSKATTKPTATIGEQFTYTIKVPAALSPVALYDVRVTDDLSASVADLRYVSARWKQPDGTWRTLSNAGTATVPVLYDPVSGIDVLIGGQAEIELTVELQNTATNQDSLGTFTNTATYTYNRANGLASTVASGEGGTSGTMTIVEPGLAATKSVQFVTPAGKTTAEAAMVGDVLQYVVTLTNTGTSKAYELNVADTLPAGVVLDSAFVPTATIGGVAVAGFNPVPATINGATVWGRDNNDPTLALGVGESLVLTYRVTVVSVTGAPIQNTVYTDWTSLLGTSTAERTGVDCLAGTTPALNDYCVGPTRSSPIATMDNTSITKAATLDSYAEPVAGTDPIVRVGDTVTYELTLNVQEYTTRSVVVSDKLPAGMVLESFSIVPGGTTFTMVLQPTVPSAAGATLTWDFGDIYNAPSNDGTPIDPLVLRYVAKVVTDAPPVGVDTTTSILRDNTAKLTYTGGDPTVYPARLTSAERIEVRQPAMSAIAKSGTIVPTPTRTVLGTGAQSSPYQVLVASDTANFQIRSCNNGLAPAYGVEVTDLLANAFNTASINGLTVSANGAVLASPADYAYSLSGNTMRFTLAAPVNPGQCVTIAYNVGFLSDVTPNSIWSNEAKLVRYASLPAAGRLYAPTDVAQVWMTNAFAAVPPLKTLFAPTSGEAAVGEEVTYEITVPSAPANAALNSVVITDTLDARLKFVTYSQLSGPTVALTAGSNLQFTVAQIPAGQQVKLQVKARVDNVDLAQAGSVSNTVSYTYGGLAGGSSTAALRIVEPVLAIDKTVPTSQPTAGDILTYSLAITASGGTATDLYSTAHDVIIRDTLGLGLDYVEGSAKLNGVAIADPAVVGDGTTANQVLTWNTGLDIAEGSAPVITYQVQVLGTVGAGQTLRNDVRVEWTSVEGASSYERTGTGTPTANDYFDTDFTILTTLIPGAPTKTSSQPTATIGEQFSYTIAVPSAGTTAATALYDVQIYDTLAANVVFVSAEVDMTGTGSGPWTPLANSGTTTALVLGGASFDIGATGKALVRINVELRNDAINQRSVSFGNSAYYTYNQAADGTGPATSPTSNTVTMTVVEPEVSATAPAVKTVANVTSGKTATAAATAGDVLQYVVTVPNSGDSTAYDVNVLDTLPAGTVLNPAFTPTATVNGVAVPLFKTAPTISGQNVVWGRNNADDTLDIPAGQSLVLTYQVSVISATGADITNRVYVDWTSLNAASGAERTGANCPTATAPNDYCFGPVTATLTTTDSTFLTKAVYADDYAESPTSTTDPIVRVGDTVTYDLTANLQEGTTQNVVVSDVLPQGLAFVSAQILPKAGISYTGAGTPAVSGNTVTWSFGTVTNTPSGDNTPLDPLVIRYVARVATAAPTVGVAIPSGAGVDTSILRDNSAKLSYTGGDPAAAPARLTATERIDVRQPWMSPLTKVDVGASRTGSGIELDPYVVNLAADTMSFRLSSCNNGLASAYGVTIADTLATPLDESDLASAPVVRIGATTLALGTDFTYSAPARGGVMQITLIKAVEPTQCVTVEYSVGFHTDVAANSKWANSAQNAAYASLPSGGRVYAASTPARVWMTNAFYGATPTKTVNVTEAVIGQEVVYTIVIPAPNAALNNVVIDDPLATSLEYVGFSSNHAGVALVGGSNVRFTIPQIPAGFETRIDLTARVANVTDAQTGTVTNVVSYRYDGSAGATVPLSATRAFNIVEPAVDVAKVVSNATPAIGERLTYTLTLTSSGGAAFSDARDVKIVDRLGAGLQYVPNSTTGLVAVNPIITLDASGNQVLTWDTGIDITEGTAPTLTYQVDVLATVGAGQTLRNDVRVEWTSLDAASTYERTGSGTPTVNDYFDTAFAIAMTPLTVNFTKSVDKATAMPGETLHYRVTLSNTNVVPLTNVTVQDVLAAEFQAGTLANVVAPGATVVANPTGGANGTGSIDVQLASLAAGAALTIDFDVVLKSVLTSGTTVLNQATLTANAISPATSNQTSTLINSAPTFRVEKTSADLTGDVNVLRAGDTLRYTITMQNTGNEDATGVTLRDVVPTYTTYVAGSTRLNGGAVADVSGVSPLQTGLAIGNMSATVGTATNVATVTFDVVVNASVVDGTIVSNQGYVNASGAGSSGPVAEKPSDDPATPVLDDPTRDIVGSLPLLDAMKAAALQTDLNTNGAIDAGETVRYTMTVSNFGTVAATDVVLTDATPANTTYAPSSVTLNGAAVGDVAGASPLVGGLQVGPIAAGATATVTFDVVVNGGVAAGTAISNQGYVASPGLASEPTDADGYDANGDQPTVVYVGSGQQLAIAKSVIDLDGGVVEAGDTLQYVVRVDNVGAADATTVVISDNLAPLAGLAAYVPGSAKLNVNGTETSVTDGAVLSAIVGTLPAGQTATLRFNVVIADVAPGTGLLNTGEVTWNTPTLSLQDSVSVAVGAVPGAATLGGRVWHDTDFDNAVDAGEQNLDGWTVELRRNNTVVGTATTANGGLYSFAGVAPSATPADSYEVRFAAPGTTATTAKLGMADSVYSDHMQRITDIVAVTGGSADNLALNLPLDPSGVVYNAITRAPIAGATVRMLRNGAAVDSACFADPTQQGQVTLASGFYKFDLQATCLPANDVVIEVTPPATGYVAGPSRLIPPLAYAPTATDPGTAPYSAAGCSSDAISPDPAGYCEAQPSAYAPAAGAPTAHYLYLALATPVPGASQVFNNHIAVDPTLDEAVTISKTSALVNVSRGQLVPYVITVNNTMATPLDSLQIVDTFPPGFKYVEGSARVDGQAFEPVKTNRTLTWNLPALASDMKKEIKLLFIVGSGVGEGEYVNRARVMHTLLGKPASGEAQATVRVVPDPTFDCTDIIGKVFDDANHNGYQDPGEKGLPGVRVATARGLLITTDEHGRFHVTCAVVPDENRGSNFILKVDDRSLPTGYRVTTDNPNVQRVTRGKMAKFNFGATIHKVVRIDVANGVFEPGTIDMRLQWKPRMGLLMGELKKAPSTLRLAYMAEIEDESLVNARLKALKQEITDRWVKENGPYELVVETEVFWRTGAPPKRSALK